MGTSPNHISQKGKWSLQTILLGLFSLIGLPTSLFISAGRWDWQAGWLYIAITLLGVPAGRLLVAMKSADLATARVQAVPSGEIKQWDKWLMPYSAIFGPLLVFVIAGLNERLWWGPDMLPWLTYPGILLLLISITFFTWAMLVNRFFSKYVRIQQARGHEVNFDGPYRIVCHPGYISESIGYLAMPMMLGSLWALIPAGVGIAMLVLRTHLEDKTLQEELPGYQKYAQKVKYRLIPLIW